MGRGLEGRLKDNQQGIWRPAALGLSLVLAITSATYLGCKKAPPGSGSRTPSRGLTKLRSEEATLAVLSKNLPFWKPWDLQINKDTGAKVAYEYILKEKPPFYRGEMPLRYTSVQRPELPMIAERDPVKLMYDFGDFKTCFVYDDSANLKGIVAVDKTNTVVAEANVERDPSTYERTMYEFHYSNGIIVFKCKSKVDDMGNKTEEGSKMGLKRREYFFLVPEMFQ